jgi:polyprenyl P-hydroxybenzoate/phenylacrylic acid decarboxylase-like protein
MKKRLIVGVTGATGAVYAYELLHQLRALGDIETHLVMSAAAVLTARQELRRERPDFEAVADVIHNVKDIGASIASGSFITEGMVIVPCSMKTLAAVAHGYSDNLISRAADVILKQRRRLVLVTRETPLNLAHIRNMETVTLMGGIIFPPVPAFYADLASLDDMVTHTVGRILDLFDIRHDLVNRWRGLGETLKD